jgi:site-specific DNA-methyltransferase (adenine-specific)
LRNPHHQLVIKTQLKSSSKQKVPAPPLGTVCQVKKVILPPSFTFLKGDASEQLKNVASESVHAVVCDPPYGLTSNLELEDMLHAWLKGETFYNDSNGYDGADWDNSVPGPELWREVLRVLAPGGFLLAFAATRTVGLTQVAIQLAGFEVRDLINWVYAPGRQATRDLGRVAADYDDARLAEQLSDHRSTLRPGHEPIVVARKPFDDDVETIENVIEFGVGALDHRAITGSDRLASNVWFVHDSDCAEAVCLCRLDDQEGAMYATHLFSETSIGHGLLSVAKASKAERPVGADGVKHETVKPLLLISRLIEAVSRPGQVVLDPFLGSGTTAEAALLCGRNVVGCELEPRYWSLIEARIDRVTQNKEDKTAVRRGSSGVQSTSVRPRRKSEPSSGSRASSGEKRGHKTLKKERDL